MLGGVCQQGGAGVAVVLRVLWLAHCCIGLWHQTPHTIGLPFTVDPGDSGLVCTVATW